jgi:hypothetical protein
MRKALRTSGLLASVFVATAAGCGLVSSDPEDEGSSGNSGASGGSAGTTSIGLGAASGTTGGGTSGATAAGGDGSGDGTSAPPGCTTLEGLGECGTMSIEAEYRTANILLVIDKSGSMTDTPSGFDTDKWKALKAALEESLGDAADEVNLGLVLYPFSATGEIPLDGCDSTGNCCEVPSGAAAVNVPVQPGTTSVPLILDALDQTSPGGGTPTAAALEAAYDYFVSGEGAALEGDRYVLLATDGGPNCNESNSCEGERCTSNLDGNCSNDNCCSGSGNGAFCLDDESVVAQIDQLKGEGIPTFVVGIPGTEVYASYLDQFALAGGATNPGAPPEYYAVEAEGGVAALAKTFTDITQSLVRSCEVPLGAAPGDPELVNVAVDCEALSGDQWQLEAGATTLNIIGTTCDWIESKGARRVDVVYGCMTLR